MQAMDWNRARAVRSGSNLASGRTLRVVKRFNAAAACIFAAWLDPAIARQWLFATASHPVDCVEIDARVGGTLRLSDTRDGRRVEYAGRFTGIVADRRLAFSLVLPDNTGVVTRVTVDVAARKMRAMVELVHENVPAEIATWMKSRWIGMFYGLDMLVAASRRGTESFDRADCRFPTPPIDYRLEPAVFRHAQE